MIGLLSFCLFCIILLIIAIYLPVLIGYWHDKIWEIREREYKQKKIHDEKIAKQLRILEEEGFKLTCKNIE